LRGRIGAIEEIFTNYYLLITLYSFAVRRGATKKKAFG